MEDVGSLDLYGLLELQPECTEEEVSFQVLCVNLKRMMKRSSKTCNISETRMALH